MFSNHVNHRVKSKVHRKLTTCLGQASPGEDRDEQGGLEKKREGGQTGFHLIFGSIQRDSSSFQWWWVISWGGFVDCWHCVNLAPGIFVPVCVWKAVVDSWESGYGQHVPVGHIAPAASPVGSSRSVCTVGILHSEQSRDIDCLPFKPVGCPRAVVELLTSSTPTTSEILCLFFMWISHSKIQSRAVGQDSTALLDSCKCQDLSHVPGILHRVTLSG